MKRTMALYLLAAACLISVSPVKCEGECRVWVTIKSFVESEMYHE